MHQHLIKIVGEGRIQLWERNTIKKERRCVPANLSPQRRPEPSLPMTGH